MRRMRHASIRATTALLLLVLLCSAGAFAAAKPGAGQTTDPGEPPPPDSGEPTDPESAPVDGWPTGWLGDAAILVFGWTTSTMAP